MKQVSGCSAVRLAHLLWEQGVVGSNPATPTIIKPLIIRYPLIVSGYFLALYLNIKTLNNQQCNWLRGGCDALFFCESAYRIYMSDLMKSKKVSQLLYVDIFFVPFNICIFALRRERLIPQKGHVCRSYHHPAFFMLDGGVLYQFYLRSK